jgi:inhibin beta
VQPEHKRDEIRLETIKRQILSKLGLKEKPNITSPVPREVILETLYRAEETGGRQDGGLVAQEHVHADEDSPGPSSARPPESEPDDFYGRTSEIIAFAEPGETTLH